MDFIENLLLPDKPLNLGDQWVTSKSLRSVLPKEAIKGKKELAERTISVVRTLKAVRPWKDSRVAEFTAPLKFQLEEITLDEDGTRGSVEFDAAATSLIDVRRGIIVEETVKGTVSMRPKGRRDLPSLITCDVSANVTLANTTSSPELTLNTRKN